MNGEFILQRTKKFVRDVLGEDPTGHDWRHTERVLRNAMALAQEEDGLDLLVVQLSALLHDVADWKFHGGDLEAGPAKARQWLLDVGLDEARIEHVCSIVRNLSFKGAGVDSRMQTREGMIVQDADRLDALGAIGIARAFAYGGFDRRPLHDPEVQAVAHQSFEEYKRSKGPTINHFYEKLLLLKDLMNTERARQIAEQRTRFMQDFIKRFLLEWEGRDTCPDKDHQSTNPNLLR